MTMTMGILDVGCNDDSDGNDNGAGTRGKYAIVCKGWSRRVIAVVGLPIIWSAYPVLPHSVTSL